MKVLTTGLILAILASSTLAAPIEVVEVKAPPRLGYALGQQRIGQVQPRSADRPQAAIVGKATPTSGFKNAAAAAAAAPTKAPIPLAIDATPNEIYNYYGPVPDTNERVGPEPYKVQNVFFDWYQPEKISASKPSKIVQARDDIPPVPTAQLGYPTFPANIASCQKCEPNYPKISSCALASSAFQNGTTIFSDPTKYYSIIKCACVDTFQNSYPQCLDCFQHTDQCYYLGTDPKGTQAPAIITNMRQICALGSSLLGGVASTNQHGYNYSYTPSSPGTYTDVNSYAPGYIDQGAGPIFQSSSNSNPRSNLLVALVAALSVVALSTAAVM
ncbi:unnamed protein product [Sympodiomycopsis kandeliae]